MKKNILLVIFCLTVSMQIYGQTLVNGIYYNFSGTTAEVTSGTPKYTGDVVIPSIVTYNGNNFSVISIGKKAFANCDLSSITIPASVTNLEEGAFDCQLISINVDNRNADYSSDNGVLFNKNKTILLYCPDKKNGNYVIPNSVVSIADGAFQKCRSLTSVTIPNSVTSIGDWAFQDCRSLTSITIPNNVITIGKEAFSLCRSLASITIPASVTTIGSRIFDFCDSLTFIKVENRNANYSSDNGVLFNKNKTILLYCPDNKTGDYVIPNSVTNIENYAFQNCKRLTSITLPQSVRSIENRVFSLCVSLISINIPDGITTIGDDAFSSCSHLTSITIPSSVKSIGSAAFSGCSRLTSITIPSNVKSIEKSTFFSCGGLTSITIPESVKSIGEMAFWGCSGLSAIVIPSNVTNIGQKAFENCEGLTSLSISEGVTSIGRMAFEGCKSLTAISIPKSVTNVEPFAFSGTPWENNQTDRIIYINKMLYRYIGTMPANTAIKIPEGTLSIVDYAFHNCKGLTSITIPSSVTRIGDYAFQWCEALTSITVLNPIPVAISSSVFPNVNKNTCKLKVPANAISNYQNANVWKEFKNIEFIR